MGEPFATTRQGQGGGTLLTCLGLAAIYAGAIIFFLGQVAHAATAPCFCVP
jgi:hypothetical protein